MSSPLASATPPSPGPGPGPAPGRPRPVEPVRAGSWLTLWVFVVVLAHGVAWLGGVKGYALAEAVEQGAANAETRGIGELGDDAIRKAIRTQQATLPFWTALAALGDFLADPLALVIRAVIVATAFAGFAALVGRPIRFDDGFTACAAAQGFWALGVVVRTGLMLALRRLDVETSATLLLTPGSQPAYVWVAVQQLDAFAILGYLTMAFGGWRRGQVNLVLALFLCGSVWFSESILRILYTLLLGAGMRLTLIPRW